MRNQPFTRNAVKMGDLALPSRRDQVVRRIAADWRRLTTPDTMSRNGPGDATLIACSGGGDSSALVIALAAIAGKNASKWLTVAHVVHDLRSRSEAANDRDRAAALAGGLELSFAEASVNVRERSGNDEANARKLRYSALAEMARRRGIRFVATAHNSHDAVESVLMALLRGAGPRGLAGISAEARLGGGVKLIRPMLGVTPVEARALCSAAGWSFVHDATNDDPARLRNALRQSVLPRLLELRPSAPARIASAADRCRETADAISQRARYLVRGTVEGQPVQFDRDGVRGLPVAVLGEVLRRCAVKVGGRSVLDQLSARAVLSAVRLIRSAETDPKLLQWSGVTVSIDSRRVLIAPAVTPSASPSHGST